MRYRAVERPNMMGGRGFRVEELKSRTFVFQFLALMHMMPNHILVHEMSLIPSILTIPVSLSRIINLCLLHI